MIPTIEDIIAKLLSGEMGKGEAERLIYMHTESAEQRHYYAGQAITGLIASGPHDCSPRELSQEAYMYADAMIEAGK